MQYYSTRDAAHKVTADRAIARGLAPDGGLYVPETLPSITLDDIKQIAAMDYRARASHIMGMFLDSFTKDELDSYVNHAYSSNYSHDDIAPVHILNSNTAILELFHGPTCAFKDMALQMLPYLLTASLKKTGEKRQACILVATSGDTGKAALEGFADVEGTRIMVFYPENGVSDVQRLQMVTQSGDNVMVCAVEGNFDDAQTGVKKIFVDKNFSDRLDGRGFYLSSANSINWGRLLPQIVYYISAYCDYVNKSELKLGEGLNFCVPTGNFGNILAGWYAKKMGLPIGRLICASNENNVLTDFIKTGVYDRNREFYTTISPSMDILVSSNLERLLYHLSGDDKETSSCMSQLSERGRYEVSSKVKQELEELFYSGCCSDVDTKSEIAALWADSHYLMDTHTAVAYRVMRQYRSDTGDDSPAVIVSTASPYKFADSVLSALGVETELSGAQQIESLEKLTGIKAPAPLKDIRLRKVRFEDCVSKEGMIEKVDAFLI